MNEPSEDHIHVIANLSGVPTYSAIIIKGADKKKRLWKNVLLASLAHTFESVLSTVNLNTTAREHLS
jgi:hypothetical protein